jgi:hypothetical protein
MNPIMISLPDKDLEAMDIICSRLSARKIEETLESGATAWNTILEAKKNLDLEMLRTFDACYSKRNRIWFIKEAVLLLRRNIPDKAKHKVTPEAMESFREVIKAISLHDLHLEAADRISSAQAEELKSFALTNPEYGEGISRLITERGMKDVPGITAIIDLSLEGAPAVTDGLL